MKKKIVIAASGTGGHLFPALALARRLGEEVLFMGHKLKDNPFFHTGEFPFVEVEASSFGSGFFLKNGKGFFRSLFLLLRLRPDVIIGFGSYHTFPVLLAALFLRKKIFLFEPNTVLGRVNRFFAPLATKVMLQFPLPIKRSVLVPFFPWEEKRKMPQEEALSCYDLKKGPKTLLIFGGSQGATFFEEMTLKLLDELKKRHLSVQAILLTGKKTDLASRENLKILPFEKEMEKAYQASDLVIARSGASTLGELITFQKMALLIPFPFSSEEHQKKNGQFFASVVQGGRCLDEKEATTEIVADEIIYLLKHKERFEENIRAFRGKQERMDISSLVQREIITSLESAELG